MDLDELGKALVEEEDEEEEHGKGLRFEGKSDEHKSLLKAIEEAIAGEKKGPPTAAEVLAALISTLSFPSKHAVELLELVEAILPQAESVVRAKFEAVVDVLERLNDGNAVGRRSLKCLAMVLAAQEGAAWQFPNRQRALLTVLKAAMDPKPKTRKSARPLVRLVSEASPSAKKLIRKFIDGQLPRSPYHALALAAEAKVGTEAILTLLRAGGDARVVSCALAALRETMTDGTALEVLATFSGQDKTEWAKTTARCLELADDITEVAPALAASGEPAVLRAAALRFDDPLVREAIAKRGDDDLVELYAETPHAADIAARLAPLRDRGKCVGFFRKAAESLGTRFLRTVWSSDPRRIKWVAPLATATLPDFLALVLPVAVKTYPDTLAWGLAPSACRGDLEQLPAFLPTLKAALEDEPVRPVAARCCSALGENPQMTGPAARELLPALLGAAMAGAETTGIARLVPLCPDFASATVRKVAKRLVSKRSRDDAPSSQVPQLCAIGAALVPGLDPESKRVLWRALPLSGGDAGAEKAAYGAALALVPAVDVDRLVDLSCHVTSRFPRLQCLEALVAHDPSIVGKIVAETVLCLKDSSAKTRRQAFAVLDEMRRATPEEELRKMLVAGLAARTPHMRSAAMGALTRVVYDGDLPPELLRAALLLVKSDSREVVKAALVFVHLAVARLIDTLEPMLPEIVQSLLVWAPEKKARFRAKVKTILRKLCRRYGFDKLKHLVPNADEPLVSHLRKVDQRRLKRKSSTASVVVVDDDDDDDDDDDEGEDSSSDEELENVQMGKDDTILVTSEDPVPKQKPSKKPSQQTKLRRRRRRPKHLKGKAAAAAKHGRKLKSDATRPGALQPYDWTPLRQVGRKKQRTR